MARSTDLAVLSCFAEYRQGPFTERAPFVDKRHTRGRSLSRSTTTRTHDQDPSRRRRPGLSDPARLVMAVVARLWV